MVLAIPALSAPTVTLLDTARSAQKGLSVTRQEHFNVVYAPWVRRLMLGHRSAQTVKSALSATKLLMVTVSVLNVTMVLSVTRLERLSVTNALLAPPRRNMGNRSAQTVKSAAPVSKVKLVGMNVGNVTMVLSVTRLERLSVTNALLAPPR